MCTYLLVAIVRKRLGVEASMHEILQILSLCLFEQTPLDQLLKPIEPAADLAGLGNQLNLFE